MIKKRSKFNTTYFTKPLIAKGKLSLEGEYVSHIKESLREILKGEASSIIVECLDSGYGMVYFYDNEQECIEAYETFYLMLECIHMKQPHIKAVYPEQFIIDDERLEESHTCRGDVTELYFGETLAMRVTMINEDYSL